MWFYRYLWSLTIINIMRILYFMDYWKSQNCQNLAFLLYPPLQIDTPLTTKFGWVDGQVFVLLVGFLILYSITPLVWYHIKSPSHQKIPGKFDLFASFGFMSIILAWYTLVESSECSISFIEYILLFYIFVLRFTSKDILLYYYTVCFC